MYKRQSVALPKAVALGDSVTVHITGTNAGDGLRCWLGANGQITMVANNEWITTTASGDFDLTMKLTAFDKDGKGATEATELAFKGASWGKNLSGVSVKSIEIIYPSEEPEQNQ